MAWYSTPTRRRSSADGRSSDSHQDIPQKTAATMAKISRRRVMPPVYRGRRALTMGQLEGASGVGEHAARRRFGVQIDAAAQALQPSLVFGGAVRRTPRHKRITV